MVTAEEFVKAWQESSNYKEVCEKTGLDVNNVSTRASNYRKGGVKLKHMKNRRNRLDIDALNELCK